MTILKPSEASPTIEFLHWTHFPLSKPGGDRHRNKASPLLAAHGVFVLPAPSLNLPETSIRTPLTTPPHNPLPPARWHSTILHSHRTHHVTNSLPLSELASTFPQSTTPLKLFLLKEWAVTWVSLQVSPLIAWQTSKIAHCLRSIH